VIHVTNLTPGSDNPTVVPNVSTVYPVSAIAALIAVIMGGSGGGGDGGGGGNGGGGATAETPAAVYKLYVNPSACVLAIVPGVAVQADFESKF
jgi:hypothetical protein